MHVIILLSSVENRAYHSATILHLIIILLSSEDSTILHIIILLSSEDSTILPIIILPSSVDSTTLPTIILLSSEDR